MSTKKINIQDIGSSSYYQDAIKSYHRIIEILRDASYVENYLKNVKTWQDCEEIILLRLHVDWFDCAMSMLQEEEIYYLDDVKQKAIYYLNRYYRPNIESDLTKDLNWQWLMRQNNEITTNVFKIYSRGIIPLYPIKQASAAGPYQMGTSYTELLLYIPASSQAQIEMNIPLKISIAFRWTDEKMWGEINILVNSEKVFSRNQKHFLTLFHIDLIDSSRSIEENLTVNAYGKFFISNDFNKINAIKEFLNNKKLHCTLKLHA